MPFNTETHRRDGVEQAVDENVEISLSHRSACQCSCRNLLKTHFNYFKLCVCVHERTHAGMCMHACMCVLVYTPSVQVSSEARGVR